MLLGDFDNRRVCVCAGAVIETLSSTYIYIYIYIHVQACEVLPADGHRFTRHGKCGGKVSASAVLRKTCETVRPSTAHDGRFASHTSTARMWIHDRMQPSRGMRASSCSAHPSHLRNIVHSCSIPASWGCTCFGLGAVPVHTHSLG